jgi:hypothetical protein
MVGIDLHRSTVRYFCLTFISWSIDDIWSSAQPFHFGERLTDHLTTSSLLASLDALPESMFPFPSSLGYFLLSSPLLGPVIQVVRDLVVGLENCNGVVPSGFKPGEKGAVSDFIVVLRPVLVVLLWLSGFVSYVHESI